MPLHPTDIDATLEVLERYPWYAYAALRGLDQCDASDRHEHLADILSVCIGDPAVLETLIGERPTATPASRPSAPTTSDTIDAFISRYGAAESQLPPTVAALQALPPVEMEDTPARPADVRELIKKGEYEAAIEIIKGLNLNNSEKSIYFADQIRFLKKLIINRKKAGTE